MLCLQKIVFGAVALSLALAPGVTAQRSGDLEPSGPYAVFNASSYGEAEGLDLGVAVSNGGGPYTALSLFGPAGTSYVLLLGASQQNVPFQGIHILVGDVAASLGGVLPSSGLATFPLALPQYLDPGVEINAYSQAIGLGGRGLIASQGWQLNLQGVAGTP